MERANEVLEFWFGRGPWDAARLAERAAFWFGGDGAAPAAERDALIRTTLEPMLERAARGEFASWSASPKRRLALILLFDQVPRNAYRGTAAAFAFDREALALSVEGLQLAADAALDPLERLFFYLPLEHAESMEAQDAAVASFERLVAEAPPELQGLHRIHAEVRAPASRHHREVRPLSASATACWAARARAAELEWLANADHLGRDKWGHSSFRCRTNGATDSRAGSAVGGGVPCGSPGKRWTVEGWRRCACPRRTLVAHLKVPRFEISAWGFPKRARLEGAERVNPRKARLRPAPSPFVTTK